VNEEIRQPTGASEPSAKVEAQPAGSSLKFLFSMLAR
jgi:hypothetical protein